MSTAGIHAHAFYKGVATERKVWTIKDSGGFPAPKTSDGRRSQPFWSSLSRVEKIIQTVPAYSGFETHEISWETFKDKWIPGLTRDKLLMGLNWSGKAAMGYDIEPSSVLESIEFHIDSDEV